MKNFNESSLGHRFPGTGSKIVTVRRSLQSTLVVALEEKASLSDADKLIQF
ncbi:hypothetical protein LEP1GSC188_2347 [Leptospira weilii serovar Topaz str. LT2116]|uniref:Uncharacterized protein n=1 Tax=Leptospira weilii serovar Topaz str. LT2116 TaxID=1088540 RepID=M3GYR9_9LEPT|nr:hypothetical protein LEP1GSC188_2347 [Leptospira weilii serovar Topaz str. LT2116]